MKNYSIIAWLAGLLVLEGSACMLYASWGELSKWMQGGLLALVAVAMWGSYAWARKRGAPLGHVAGVLASVSWLVALLIVHFCLWEMPLALLGFLYLLGAALAPLLRPCVSSFASAGVASVAALALHAVACGLQQHAPFPWVQMWGLFLALLALWAQAGAWCQLSGRAAYAPYGILAPLAGALFLLVWGGGLLAAQWLHGAGAGAELCCSGALPVAGVWLVVAAPGALLHRRWAQRCGLPVGSVTAWRFGVAHLLAVPLACVAAAHAWPLLTAALMVGYGVCLCSYGRAYQLPALLSVGGAVTFTPSLGIVFSGALSPMASGVLFSVLGAVGLCLAYRLYRKQRRVLSQMHIALERQKRTAASQTDEP